MTVLQWVPLEQHHVRIHGSAVSSFLGPLFSLLPTDEFKRRGVCPIRRHKIYGLTNGFQSSVSCSREAITVVQCWSVIADPLAREIRSCWQGKIKFVKKDNVTQESSKSHHHAPIEDSIHLRNARTCRNYFETDLVELATGEIGLMTEKVDVPSRRNLVGYNSSHSQTSKLV
jgi:hypothetical protein